VPSTELPTRFRHRLPALGLDADAHVLVALSGGMDSVVLLHLLRFAADARVTAAHFDHAMRPASDADARWVRGLCTAWGVPLVEARAAEPLRTENDARRARYRFLRDAQAVHNATHLATAHHADDQAETVLFRVLRGTGIAGLAGIPERGEGGLVRPLLPFWRAELRAYARENGVRWRCDPTNSTLGPARNRIRHDLLPRIEKTLAPAARRSLVRLARLARAQETSGRCWRSARRRSACGGKGRGPRLFGTGWRLMIRPSRRAWCAGCSAASAWCRGAPEHARRYSLSHPHRVDAYSCSPAAPTWSAATSVWRGWSRWATRPRPTAPW
jgi:tRNA(Ile)-lysidine synthase